MEIFNQRSYEGHDDSELRASGVRFHGGDNSALMTIQEAVDLASLFRKDYVAQRRLTSQILELEVLAVNRKASNADGFLVQKAYR